MVAKLNVKKQGGPASKPQGEAVKQPVKKVVTPASQAKARGGSAKLGGTIGNTEPS